MKTYKTDYLNKLLELSLRVANIVDRQGETGGCNIADELNLGYLALSGYLRAGAKAVIDIQNEYSKAKANETLANISEKSARQFLTEIFGDEEIDHITDEHKAKIKAFVTNLMQVEED